MAFEQRDNSGTCFVNDRKESDKHPDWSGSGMIGGKMQRYEPPRSSPPPEEEEPNF